MNYKEGFYILLLIWLFTMGASIWALNDIHNSLDKIDEYIVDDKIIKYQKAGWLPYERIHKHRKRVPKKEKK